MSKIIYARLSKNNFLLKKNGHHGLKGRKSLNVTVQVDG